ncbi:amino acid ABC transporter substrate-binding protein, PAAT family [Andreprevotia lacus DSM 23236]|jgi:polar amino acid transport system substrate-binding protein|uniref:Amino acid ABC transporter substrate-binding protein, PAAT family n=1 Tax=Andreprevotia lacus DSM 23236 TaxID=1121001 RepID=A0A1W1Y2F2_9NEIS|nr:transporter substrate-binding domain-containing protein [Andreprevotia lacus]SMC29971.1 amino acid ABC transporter substrate-binding protein, PAAT family [Andreprevotia lacus DSM 23236]
MTKPTSSIRAVPRFCAWLAGIALLASTGCWAQDKPDCNRTYTLAFHDHGLLYAQQSDTGIDKDIATEMARRSGCKFELAVLPRARIWKLIETGELDFSLSGITNPQREQFAGFAWYFADKYALLVRKDAAIGKPEDFLRKDALRLGAIPSFRYSDQANKMYDKLAEQNRVTLTTTFDALFKNLALNRIQGMIIEPFDYPSFDEYKVRDQTVLLDFDDPAVPHGVIMSKKSVGAVEQEKWRALINGMLADGTVQRIFERYFPPKQAAAMVNAVNPAQQAAR